MSRAAVSRSRIFGKNGRERRQQFFARAKVVQIEQALGGEPGVHVGEPLRFGLVDLVEPGADQQARRQQQKELAAAPRRAPARDARRTSARSIGSAVGDGHISEGCVLGFDLVQAEIHALQAESHARQVDDRLAPRRDALVQFFGALVIVGGASGSGPSPAAARAHCANPTRDGRRDRDSHRRAAISRDCPA